MFLVITSTAITYHSTATDAARATSAFDWEARRVRLATLQPGDELEIDSNTSIVVLSGKEFTL